MGRRYIPDWHKLEVELSYPSGKQRVRSVVFGDWAIHAAPRRSYFMTFRLSHVPSGRALSQFGDELEGEDAIRIARALDYGFPAGAWKYDRDPSTAEAKEDYEIIKALFGEALVLT